MDLSSPVTSIPGIGSSIAGKLSKLGISTVWDFLYHLPFRYEDRSQISSVKDLRVGDTVTLIGHLDDLKNTVTKTGRFIQAGTFSDDTGSLTLIFFNQPFLTRTLKKGTSLALYGKAAFFGSKLALISPEYELTILNNENVTENLKPVCRQAGFKIKNLIHMARVIPVYPETAGITSKWLRTKMINLLPKPDSPDILPAEIVTQIHLPSWAISLNQIHFPTSYVSLPDSRGGPAESGGGVSQTEGLRNDFHSRLAFDELLLLQLTALLRREKWQKTRLAHTFHIDSTSINQFIASLPFSLTTSQQTAIGEILHDLGSKEAMNRLLEGDVGSGKTVVAAVATLAAHLNGFQTILLAPTQILATQHYQTFQKLFKDMNINIELVLGNTNKNNVPSSSKRGLRGDFSADLGNTSIFIGTHALLSTKIKTDNVGLVIIDEQHRFGVAQRALAAQKGTTPHILTMTATPIPRSIALTLYGDLDLSVLTDVPTGRLPVKTWVVPENKRQDAYKWIKTQLVGARSSRPDSEILNQAFIVCPFIEPSETLTSVKSATTEYEKLQKIFPEFKLGLLHGRLKPAEKDEVIAKFRAGEYQILVATPVVEVGIDIPQATIMVIEGADRFGLAQLHQLRGRVGRSDLQSYCYLFADKDVPRLNEMQTHFSGLELAEIDLKLRGPGEIYGTAQHGVDQLHIANYSDLELISKARQAAYILLPQLPKLPALRQLLNHRVIDAVQPN